MDWSKVSSNIGGTAPLLASLIGGPEGPGLAVAVTLLSHVLGTADDPRSIASALGDPEALDKVRQAERANAIQLQQLAVTAAQAQLTERIENARDAADDRRNTRDTGAAMRDWVPKVLAMAVTFGFFGILVLMALKSLPDTNRDLVNVILGSLGTAWISIIGYYFGTSAGSARKTELLAQPSIPVTPDSAITLKEPAPKPGAGDPQSPPAAPAHIELFPPMMPGAQGPVF